MQQTPIFTKLDESYGIHKKRKQIKLSTTYFKTAILLLFFCLGLSSNLIAQSTLEECDKECEESYQLNENCECVCNKECDEGYILDEENCECIHPCTCENASDYEKIVVECHIADASGNGNDCTKYVRTVLKCNWTICEPCHPISITCENASDYEKIVVKCDDGNPCTKNDKKTVLKCDKEIECVPCRGTPINRPACNPCEKFNPATCKCEQIIKEGDPCNDGRACTINDRYSADCECWGDLVGNAGAPCDDDDPCTYDDQLNEDCQCVGTPDRRDSDRDGIPNCIDSCPYNIDEMVYADLKCGVPIGANNFNGRSEFQDYGECSPPECPSTGRELIFRFEVKTQMDLVINFEEKAAYRQLRKLNLFIVDNICSPTNCLENAVIHAPASNGNAKNRLELHNVAPGIYYIIVDGNTTYARNPFILSVDCGGSAYSCPDDAYYTESFEHFRAGSQITREDGAHWQIEGRTNRSAMLSDKKASNDKQSLVFNRLKYGIQDVNLLLDRKFRGAYMLTWDMYIGRMGTAHFGLFGGDNSDPWGSIGHKFRMSKTKYQGRWFKVELLVDLDKNKYTLYMDNRHFKEEGKYYLNLYHLNFYSPPGGDFFIDNFCFADLDANALNGALTDDREQTDLLPEKGITVFPNPARDEVFLDLRDYYEKEVDVVIYNTMSREAYRKHIPRVSKDLEKIPLDNFTNGVHIINVNGKGIRPSSKKLIISRFY